jgi:hypothetical protein
LLVDERGDELRLFSPWPPSWLGQPAEVHHVLTQVGPVSAAVRWHGARPALLWDAPGWSRVSCPGLDPGWAAAAGRGEALLNAPD